MTEERTRDLEKYANTSAQPIQPTPGGHSLVRPTTGLAERVIGAHPVAVHRDEAKILQKLAALAAATGSDWFYRFPVRKEGGGQDWIEGPSIKLANDVARIFGNNINEVREIDVGDAWVFYARFTDIETGFSMERAYHQRKSQTSLKTKDRDRQLDIAYSIGQSKAIRNCIVNSLQVYCDYAFECARDSLVEKIGRDLESWRKRTLEGLARIPVDLPRVERVIGRAAKDWLAPDIARIVAMGKSISDGMASPEEVFPLLPSEPSAQSMQPQAKGPEENKTAAAEKPEATVSPAGAPRPSAPASGAAKIAEAYARGQEWRERKGDRKAMPPGYRTPERSDEAAAWTAGFDGAAMPTPTPKEPTTS
jgi:hypothetical protein